MKFSLAEENKNLRVKLSEEQVQSNEVKKHLRDKIIDLENKVSDLEFLNTEQSINLKVLEEELINKTTCKKKSESSTKIAGDIHNSKPCFSLHTSSISGINDYISLLAKAKDDVIHYKKESANLHSQVEHYKKKLGVKTNEIEKLKCDLEYSNRCNLASKKVCICHDVDSNYESLDDSKSEELSDSKSRPIRGSKVCYSKSNCKQCKTKSRSEFEADNRKKRFTDAAIQVNDFEKVLKNRLDEYIRKAKDIIPEEISCDNHISNKIQEERDYYCREYHRLKDKILHVCRISERHPSLECPFTILDKIRAELIWQSNELEELKRNVRSKQDSTTQYTGSKHNLEDRLRRLETKESELMTINDKLASKIRKLEDQCDRYREKIQSLSKENGQQKSIYSQIRMMQDDSERSLFNAQDALRKCDSELNCALSKLSQLEEDNRKLKKDLSIIESEKKCLKKNLIQLDHDKDSIGLKLDEKTELAVRLEKELREKRRTVVELQEKVNKLDESLKILQNINIRNEEGTRHAKKGYTTMQQEVIDLQHSRDILIAENRRLQDNLSTAVRDCFQSNNELQSTKTEVEELKIRLQSYVSEVRRIEDILQNKEDERRSMLEQLKGLNIEYSSNNSKSRTMENFDNVPLDSLLDF